MVAFAGHFSFSMEVKLRTDIIGSIILTLALWLVCSFFHIGLFGSIILMLLFFLALNYRGLVMGYLYNVLRIFERRKEVRKAKSSYEQMHINEED